MLLRPRAAFIPFVLVVAFLAAGCSSPSPANDGSSTTIASKQGTSNGPSDRIPDIVQNVSPSTVSIHTDAGDGSGVVWNTRGDIVTNEHVTRGAKNITVSFADGTHAAADLVAEDPTTDLAVLHTDRTGLKPATFATALPRVGSLAIAIGNPLGFTDTVSAGIVSSLNRDIPGSASTSAALVDLIQTDAAISPGNSGGALLDGSGRVIGINVAYIPPEASAVSIGFAIPAATVTDVVDQLLKTGKVSHAFMGLVPATLTSQIRDSLGVHATAGVVVQSVVADGLAARAGIAAGDVITAIDGRSITNAEGFLAALRRHDPDETVPVAVTRGTSHHTLQVTLVDRPPGG